jgi:hypothetical protein
MPEYLVITEHGSRNRGREYGTSRDDSIIVYQDDRTAVSEAAEDCFAALGRYATVTEVGPIGCEQKDGWLAVSSVFGSDDGWPVSRFCFIKIYSKTQ